LTVRPRSILGRRHGVAIKIKTIFGHANQLRLGGVWLLKGIQYGIARQILPDTGSILQKMPDREPKTLLPADDAHVEIRLSPVPEFREGIACTVDMVSETDSALGYQFTLPPDSIGSCRSQEIREVKGRGG
jgi:hypothetical protein